MTDRTGSVDRPVVLHVSPHPDDEVLGCGATLCALRDTGWTVVNLACSLGRPEDRARRSLELSDALAILGFVGRVADPLIDLSDAEGADRTVELVEAQVARAMDDTGARLVVSPHPHDAHHGHETVGRGVGAALRRRPGLPWWTWGLWADLPMPTIYSGFGESRLAELKRAVAAHAGEVRRAGYDDLLAARSRSAAILGVERVFGFGEPAGGEPYAELLTEAFVVEGVWRLGRPRRFDPTDPVGVAGDEAIDWWLEEASLATRRRRLRVAGQPGRPYRSQS